MPRDVLLRPASEEDVDRLVMVHLEARRAAGMPPAADDSALRTALLENLQRGDVWMAEGGATVLGYAAFTDGWLDDLYVRPEAQRTGIGSALLDVVKSRRPHGFGLWVFVDNQPARAFYGSQGLVELEQSDGTDRGQGAPDVRMVWPGEDPMACYRRLIDEVDVELGDVLARRAALTHAVQVHKRQTLAVADPGRDAIREAEIVQRVLTRVPSLGEHAVQRIMHAIITESIGASR